MTSLTTSSFASTPRQQPPPAPQAFTSDGGASGPQRQGGAGSAIGYAFPALPLVLAGLLEFARPGFLAPLADGRVSLVGLPAGFFAIAVLVLLTAVGVLAARSIRQPVVVTLVLVFTTLLAITVVVFAPSFVLILINLKT